MENNNLEKNLDNFLGNENKSDKKELNNNQDGVIRVKDGLIERIDKTLKTEDGKILLRERYF